MEGKKKRLLLAAAAASLLTVQTAGAVEQSASSILRTVASQISAGNPQAALSALDEIIELCPAFEGFLIGNGSLIRLADLQTFINSHGNSAATRTAAASALLATFIDERVRYLCGDLRVETVDLDVGFPLGSTG